MVLPDLKETPAREIELVKDGKVLVFDYSVSPEEVDAFNRETISRRRIALSLMMGDSELLDDELVRLTDSINRRLQDPRPLQTHELTEFCNSSSLSCSQL